MQYPASTGRNSAEVLRVVDSLQTGDKNGVTTPINWTWDKIPVVWLVEILIWVASVGDDVIVPPTVSTEDAKAKFGEDNVRELKPWVVSWRGDGVACGVVCWWFCL